MSVSLKTYAGIGARATPGNVLADMRGLGSRMADNGYKLRSGGAVGADTAFEQGCDVVRGEKEIFLPWKLYNGNTSILHPPPDAAYKLIDSVWDDVQDRSDGVRALFARNCQQILGEHLDDPTDLVICWMSKQGGTWRAVQIAEMYDIPVINLYSDSISYLEFII